MATPQVIPAELADRLARLPESDQLRVIALLASAVATEEKRAARKPVPRVRDLGPAPWRSAR